MPKTYEECCVEVGLNRHATPPELISQWFGYEGGEAIPCQSMNAAMKYTLYECLTTPESKKEHDEYFTKRRIQEQLSVEKFWKYLRTDYSDMPTELYDACYQEAYSAGHEVGYDEVSRCLKNIVTFLKRLNIYDRLCYNSLSIKR